MVALAILLPVVLGWGIYELLSGSESGGSDDADNKTDQKYKRTGIFC